MEVIKDWKSSHLVRLNIKTLIIAAKGAQWPALAREYKVSENMMTEIYDYMKNQLLNLC